ncbi:hypothetical protein [Leptospira weilii]|uniref:hypothetical protein n=1 Tax=Leptospira weilii TaxID=28184 RepID=UPI0012BACD58|nr:hypothetical protein [Leptospira weilii]
MIHRTLLAIVGCILIWVGCYATYTTNAIDVDPPFSLPVFLPIFILTLYRTAWIYDKDINEPWDLLQGYDIFLVILVPLSYSLFFLISIKPIFQKGNLSFLIPKRSLFLPIIVFLLSCFYLIIAWKSGIQYRGLPYLIFILISNVVVWGILLFLYIFNRKNRSLISNYSFHLLFFVWLVWRSFPWLWANF